ncbi:hypothetical protein P8935_17935 [Telmatobacter sp. DSM 110680]|uniref:Uncharacterized protein n=1 Tax=Telmatobacter sp. DSM 110680 TaxID=3036704 RepID=A0AAU7DGI3_9BACT
MAEILQQIDREIAQLQRARALLNGGAVKSASRSVTGTTRKSKKRKSNLSPEGRKRIADAVRRRWERQRKASGGK